MLMWLPIENAGHYFFHCPRYTDQRIQLFRDLHILHPLNRNILLYGSNDQYDDVFNHTFLSVHSFIRNAKRSKYISMKATTCTYLITVEKLIDSDINLFVFLVSIYHFNRNGIVNK